jgi:glycosyltransferase involved in cell wall biosynthesis
MSNNPKIIFSVIIPFKGRINLLLETINSVYQQRGIPKGSLEILAVGDRYEDKETVNKLKNTYPFVKFIQFDEKNWPGGKRNTGLKYAKGDFIAFLDSDDVWNPCFITSSYNLLENTEIDAVYNYSRPFFYGNFPLKERLNRYKLILIKELSFLGLIIFNNSLLPLDACYLPQISHILFRAKAIKNLKFKDKYIYGGEDWEFFANFLKYHKMLINPHRLLKFRYSWGSETFKPDALAKKWGSFRKVADGIPQENRQGIFYKLFKLYIGNKDKVILNK